MMVLGDFRPRLASPASVRRFCAVASLACTALLIYASLVPLHYRPLPWDETFQAWRGIPWLSLDLFHRADWVANGLVVLPAGVLAAAAIDWGRTSSWQLLLATPLIAFALTLVVLGIELVQVWFPPRTVSLNDIAAGIIGAALGPTLWVIGGRFWQQAITRFLGLPQFRDRLQWLCAIWLAGVILYSVLPLDIILSRGEWQDRITSGRIQLMPFAGDIGASSTFLDLLLSAIRMVPIGMYFSLRGSRKASAWGIWLLALALEIIQLPIYSKFVTGTAVVGGWCGGWLGYYLAKQLGWIERLIRWPAVWAVAWTSSIAAAGFLLLSGAEEWLTDTAVIASRFEGAWTAPLVRYYAGSEYSAYTVILEKIALFGAIGAACSGWMNCVSMAARRWVFWSSLVITLSLGTAIEWVQVYLPPLVPDFSDVLVYVAGYALGYVIMQVLWGKV